MPNTYKAIASVTVGSGGASSVAFTSIPSTYTDLKVVLSTRFVNTGNVDINSYINTYGTSHPFKRIYGTGSSIINESYAFAVFPMSQTATASMTANTFSNIEWYVPNYTSSSNKSFSVDLVSENNATAANASLYAAEYSNTSAITSINFDSGSGNFAQYSTFYLYGIKKS